MFVDRGQIISGEGNIKKKKGKKCFFFFFESNIVKRSIYIGYWDRASWVTWEGAEISLRT